LPSYTFDCLRSLFNKGKTGSISVGAEPEPGLAAAGLEEKSANKQRKQGVGTVAGAKHCLKHAV
jgi:hypothetical protein